MDKASYCTIEIQKGIENLALLSEEEACLKHLNIESKINLDLATMNFNDSKKRRRPTDTPPYQSANQYRTNELNT